MEGQATATFDDVEVVRDTELALLCTIAGARHWIAVSQVLPGSEVRHAGDRGRLVIPEWLAADRGLL